MFGQQEKFSIYERAVYAAYSGNLDQLLPVCHTWEDHLWAYLRVMVDVRVEQEVRINSTLAKQWQKLPDRYWNNSMTIEAAFQKVEASPSQKVQTESKEPFHLMQKYIILDDADSLIEEMYEWCRDETVKTPPQLVRFMAHIVLFFRTIGKSVKVSVTSDIGKNVKVSVTSDIVKNVESVKVSVTSDIGKSVKVSVTSDIGKSVEISVTSDFGKSVEVSVTSDIGKSVEVSVTSDFGKSVKLSVTSDIGKRVEVSVITDIGKSVEVSVTTDIGKSVEVSVTSDIGKSVEEKLCIAILETYVKQLIEEKQVELIATYTATLPQDLQIECYAKFLEGVQQADDRKQCLALAEEAGLDVARITKLVVENIRSADSVELSMDMQLLQQTATTEEDRSKINAIDWLVFDASQRAEALKQANAIMRMFVGTRKLSAARDVFNKLPAGSIDLIIRNWKKQTGSVDLCAEDENAIREYLCIKAYLDANDSFNDWFEHYHDMKPKKPVMAPGASFTERVAFEHRQKQYENELERWRHTLMMQTKTTEDKIYNVLLFVNGGWMVDQRSDCERDMTRMHQMRLLRQLCLPPSLLLAPHNPPLHGAVQGNVSNLLMSLHRSSTNSTRCSNVENYRNSCRSSVNRPLLC
ncbi:Nuclear pore complex protein [Lamellibrachia satsuma]|nr:Nuclear pore complex protein [Lamellibrachia satsuma]